jgi:ABC-2 type transport system ATP-binding protein
LRRERLRTDSMPAIQIHDLTKRYGDNVLAVDGLDLAVEAGEIFGFLGPNGAGKSTTINMLLDYVRPSSGSATVLGMDAQADSEALRQRVGVLPEGYGLYDRLSGRRHLEFAVDWKDTHDDPDALLARVGLDSADAGRSVGDYSKGMRQRLAMAMALVGDPDLLILDEPSSGLDPHGIRQMRELVTDAAAHGTTVFFSSHILGQVEAVSDRVGILHDGELVAVDTVEGLRRTVGAGSELRLRIGSPLDVDLTRIDGVEHVERGERVEESGGIVRVTCSESRAKADVVTRLHRAGVEVVDIDAETASLEDVFTAYTAGNEQGDGASGDADHERVAEVVS